MRKVRFRRVNRGGLIRVSGAVAVLCIALLMTSAASAQEAKSATQNPGNKEVNTVMKALRENGIEVTAVHSHMLTEEPRLFFMHFWANDDAAKLAKGLRAALELTNSKK